MSKLLLLAVSFSSLVAAQSVGDLDKRLGDLEKAAKAAQSAGDNAWMLTSAALVLMMTGPGLALFYGGLVRRKNVLDHDAQLRPDGSGQRSMGGDRL